MKFHRRRTAIKYLTTIRLLIFTLQFKISKFHLQLFRVSEYSFTFFFELSFTPKIKINLDDFRQQQIGGLPPVDDVLRDIDDFLAREIYPHMERMRELRGIV